MKKSFCTILLVLLFAMVSFAQQVVVSEDIAGDVVWTSDNEYILDGLIFVDSLSILTIEAGTVIKGRLLSNITTGDGASALIVRRGAQIFAEGTPESPIIFTSELDDVTVPDDLLLTDRGLWGGLILLGDAVTNQPTTENQIEGIPNNFNARYGGNDDADNSGVVRYVSIRHGGFSISGVPGDEINGLTMGAVGSGTTIEHVEVFSNLDDGYEWFGGTVNTKYLAAIMCGDDAFDYDQGWRGKNQFWFALQGDDEAGRGGEHDGGDDNETGTPYAMPIISNATYIGSGASAVGVGGDGNDRTIYLRDNAGGKYYNSIFTDYVGVGLKIEDIDGQDSRQQLEDGNILFSNNYWWGFGAGNDLLTIASGTQWIADHLAANSNQVIDPMLRGISRTNDAGLDPRPKLNSVVLSSFEELGDAFFRNVNYSGAYGPTGKLWLDGWSAASQYGILGDLPAGTPNQVVVSEDIAGDVVWTSDNEYILDGLIFVDSLSILTIEAGTVIKGRLLSNITTGDGASALIVRRGAQIFAEGTPESPIIFTSELDDVTVPDDLLLTDRGLWGGLILLGDAVTNQPTTENQIEGIPNNFNARYGGNDDADNSGVVRYVSIRHGGFSISGVPGDEINGLTMGAVGSGTTIEHVEVFSNLDDGYEWFGGTVNTKYLAAIMCGDDAFDYDQGWRGKNQFWFALQGDDEAGRGGEHDGGDDNETGTPYAMPIISNATYIGSGASAVGVGGDGNDRTIYLRDNAGGKYYNSIFTDYVGVGLKIEDIDGQDSRQQLEDGNILFSNNYWWGFGAGNDLLTIASGTQWIADHLAANSNQVIDPMLRGISRTNDAGLDPRPQLDTVAEPVGDDFFHPVLYHGAFDPVDGLWLEGWTAASFYGMLTPTAVGVDEEMDDVIPNTFSLSQNYPNPFNPTTTIRFNLPKAVNVTLSVYNVMGQKVATLVSGELNSGVHRVEWNAADLPSGMYIYRLEAGSTILNKKLTLLK